MIKCLVGFVQAASFGGSNIDPTAWEDKKCPGESRFPAQVYIISSPIKLILLYLCTNYANINFINLIKMY